MKLSNIIVRATRGNITESLHRVHFALVNAEGALLAGAGDSRLLTFARSTAKLIQALPVLESGAAERFGLTEAEIALCCASHNGEAEHVSAAQGILSKLGLNPLHLQCGAHEPYHAPTAQAMRERGEKPTTLHNNCSGKHSGMLALCAQLGASPDTYMAISHPVQQAMLEAVSAMSNVAPRDMELGIDGCGVPVFGMPLDKLALAFARLGKPDGLPAARQAACRGIVAAVRKFPAYLAGEDRFDTQLIEVTGGRIVGKMGAEGMFALTIPDKGLGLSLKIEDGNQRALYPAVLEALIGLNLLTSEEAAKLADFRQPVIRNWQGTEVGRILPQFLEG
ncbi:asparaginase [Paenibacillus whitsoniae]|uniref:Asparaginase n=1 Tax=Paenibacillus whitsoniae TaxID=2496558 RepID=A0A3S0C6Z1_9BACL|nr:asparaginase [Paenibacillus whitsoniae]RTE03628.1 asparaginase [Paenibacillus whitsoniae]